MTPVAEEYARRAERHRQITQQRERRFTLVGNLRLAAGIGAVLLAFFVFGNLGLSPWWLALPIAAFIALVVYHARVVRERDCSRRALRFYEQALGRVHHKWMGKGEQGARYQDPNHVYAPDLDVLGEGSLYELLCTARTRAGEDTLARWLLHPASIADAQGRQQAVAELAPKLDLREALALVGDDLRSGFHGDSLTGWGTREPVAFPPGLPLLAALLSTATLLSLAGYLAGFTGRVPLLSAILLQLVVAFFVRSRVQQVVHSVELPSHDLSLLAGMLERIETEPAQAPLLAKLKERLRTGGHPASERIHSLESLAERIEWSHNEFFKPIAAILMWSTQLAVAIERWRRQSGSAIQSWIDVAGEFEALCSLATYAHEHAADPFPSFAESGPLFDGDGLAHPLLPVSVGIANSVRLAPDLPLLVVSGSNMSGKSTLLRTVGLNCVLAFAGAPVRARRLTLSPLQVAAAIRVQDSLQDGKSRFYAEITRLRQVVELTAGPMPVLFLLDELLSGTNSHDRRIGAAAIVKSLVERGAIGLLTTHDLALAHIAESIQPQGLNVHFADTIENGRLHFDYQLQPGVVERSNALELMRSVGLLV